MNLAQEKVIVMFAQIVQDVNIVKKMAVFVVCVNSF
jgi:hypothetical protein